MNHKICEFYYCDKKNHSTFTWFPQYLYSSLMKAISSSDSIMACRHVYFCIFDHFEPYWNGANAATAKDRLKTWLDGYPKIAEANLDSDGNLLKYSFLYPFGA